jgi:hypothetical protein
MYSLVKAVEENKYLDLGKVDILDESTLETFRVSVTPYEGVHKDIPYQLTICFQREGWPKVMIHRSSIESRQNSTFGTVEKWANTRGFVSSILDMGISFTNTSPCCVTADGIIITIT